MLYSVLNKLLQPKHNCAIKAHGKWSKFSTQQTGTRNNDNAVAAEIIKWKQRNEWISQLLFWRCLFDLVVLIHNS